MVAQRQVFVRQAGWSLDAVSAALQLLAMSGLLMLRQAYACAGRVRHAGGDWHVYACRDAQLSLARPSGSASCCLAAPKACGVISCPAACPDRACRSRALSGKTKVQVWHALKGSPSPTSAALATAGCRGPKALH